MNDHLYPTLRRWADGKVIAKAEKKKLLDAGLIYITSSGTLATSKGVGLLQSRKGQVIMTPIDSIRKFQEGKALMLEGLSVMRQAVHDFEGVFLEWSEEAAEFDYTHANGAVEIPLTQDTAQTASEPAKEPEPVETTQADPEPVEATPEPTETTPEPVDEAPSAPVVSLDEVRAAAAAKKPAPSTSAPSSPSTHKPSQSWSGQATSSTNSSTGRASSDATAGLMTSKWVRPTTERSGSPHEPSPIS